MASDQQSVEQLFAAALAQAPADRRLFLDRACAPKLRLHVEELLLADERAGFLKKPLLVNRADRSETQSTTIAISTLNTDLNRFDPATSSRFRPGQVIADRFAVHRFIASGGMGEVYEVEDRFLQGLHVALKVILPQIAGDASSSHRFEQEVLLARKVTHRNLCPIYDISRCQEPPPPFLFLTMKLLSGETLASRLNRTRLVPRVEAISIFRQMIAGLSALHEAGVVHRDIKPNNVMLDYSSPELCLSIMDFGLARLYGAKTANFTTGLVAGTPGYFAPELLRGEAPSQATDIFALGVLFQQVLLDDVRDAGAHSLSAKPSAALDSADVPAIFIQCIKEFLSDDPTRRCLAFQKLGSFFDSGSSATGWTRARPPDSPPYRILTRRNFVVGSALTACAAAGGVIWQRNTINERLNDLLHPLPLKRFVALLNWPPSSDERTKPMLLGVIDAIESELSRAEAFDRDLFVIAEKTITDITTTAQLNELRESLGANLVLATSSSPMDEELHLLLRVLDSSGTRTLREKRIQIPGDQQTYLPEKAVQAAAELLNIRRYKRDAQRTKIGTDNSRAYAAFQEAEALVKEPNDAGLAPAVEKYKEAIDLDPYYAMPNARLAWAYCRFYAIHKDPAALLLARANCTAALAINPQLGAAHIALASVLEYYGDKQGAFRETAKALAIDPSDPATLVYQAQLYFRSDRWTEAEATFARVLKLRPNYWWAHHELGVLYNSQGRYAEALSEFRAVTLETPKNALAFSNVGSVYLQQGKLDDAFENLSKSLALDPTDSAASTMAATLRAQGKYIDAVAFAKKAVKLDAEESLNWLELGDCYSLLHNHQADAKNAYAKTSELEEQELTTNPNDGPGMMVLALGRTKSGSPQTAPTLIEKADRLNSNDIDSQLYRARCLELLGRRDDALATIARCFARGATAFQIKFMPDMESLRKDPRYDAMARAKFSTTETHL